ncbi:MAG TPA: hypothetical protein VHM26_00815 [Chitinophagaceae bacterium]|jgi:hypothetical protein|nr:hypothetical protein [Chitinophagaceae bacterium]
MNQNNQPLVKVLITLTILAAITASLLIYTSDTGAGDNPFAGKLFSICYAFLSYGVLGAVCWAATRKREYKILGSAGMVISLLAFVFITVLILDENKSESTVKFALALMVGSLGMAQICFLFYLTAQNKYTNAARMVATIAISIYSLLIISRIFSGFEDFFYMGVTWKNYIKAIISLFVIGLAGCLLVPLCNQLEKPQELELETKVDPPPTPSNNDPYQPSV